MNERKNVGAYPGRTNHLMLLKPQLNVTKWLRTSFKCHLFQEAFLDLLPAPPPCPQYNELFLSL